MYGFFKDLPDWSRYLSLAAFSALGGAFGKDLLTMVLHPTPEMTKVPIMVKSEKTRKALENVDISVISNGAPLSLKTDSRGYAEPQLPRQSSIRVDLAKPGYVTNFTTLNLNDAKQLNEITLVVDQKAASCLGDSCTGRIPEAAKCHMDATTVNYATGDKFTQTGGFANVVRVELRHSPKCNASWVKVVAPGKSTVYLQDDSGSKYNQYALPQDDSSDHHTEMVSGELRLKACVQNPQGTHADCTGLVQGPSNE
jgi:hypothetical protein